MLEQAQNRRLLVDSDSDEEPAKSRTKPVAKTKPTDILQEVSGGRGSFTHRTSSPPRPTPLSWAACCLFCACDAGALMPVAHEQLRKPVSLRAELKGDRDQLVILGRVC